METVRRGDFYKKGKKIFKVLRKLDSETGDIQEQFINGGTGEKIENVTLKNCKPIAFPFTILYPEKAKKLSGEKIEDHDYFSMGYVLDDNFIASKRKEVSEKFKIKDTDIIFTTKSVEDSYYEGTYHAHLVATFHRERTKQEIERKIEDDYYTAIDCEKKERDIYERLKNKFEAKEK